MRVQCRKYSGVKEFRSLILDYGLLEESCDELWSILRVISVNQNGNIGGKKRVVL